jgi:AcrR family transcriptional regulator
VLAPTAVLAVGGLVFLYKYDTVPFMRDATEPEQRVGRSSTERATAGEASPRRGRAREDALLAAAVDLVAELGYERMTVDAIAARAHASKATLYRRWAGKAELVAEALRRQAQGPGAPTIADTGSLRGDLLAAVEGIVHALTGERGASLIGLVEAVRDDAVLRSQVRTQIEAASVAVGQLICTRAQARDELPPDVDGAPVLDLAVAQVFLTTLLHGAPPGPEEQQRLVDDVLLPLLRAPRPTP